MSRTPKSFIPSFLFTLFFEDELCCNACGKSFNPEILKILYEKFWFNIEELSVMQQKKFLTFLDESNLEKIVSVFEVLKYNNSRIKIGDFCDKKYERLAKIVEAFDEEHNTLCFIVRIVNDKYLEKSFSYFTEKSVSELSLINILKVVAPFYFYDNNEVEEAVFILSQKVRCIVCTIKDCSIEAFGGEIILFFETILDLQIHYKFFEFIFSKIKSKKAIPIKEVVRLMKKIFAKEILKFQARK